MEATQAVRRMNVKSAKIDSSALNMLDEPAFGADQKSLAADDHLPEIIVSFHDVSDSLDQIVSEPEAVRPEFLSTDDQLASPSDTTYDDRDSPQSTSTLGDEPFSREQPSLTSLEHIVAANFDASRMDIAAFDVELSDPSSSAASHRIADDLPPQDVATTTPHRDASNSSDAKSAMTGDADLVDQLLSEIKASFTTSMADELAPNRLKGASQRRNEQSSPSSAPANIVSSEGADSPGPVDDAEVVDSNATLPSDLPNLSRSESACLADEDCESHDAVAGNETDDRNAIESNARAVEVTQPTLADIDAFLHKQPVPTSTCAFRLSSLADVELISSRDSATASARPEDSRNKDPRWRDDEFPTVSAIDSSIAWVVDAEIVVRSDMAEDQQVAETGESQQVIDRLQESTTQLAAINDDLEVTPSPVNESIAKPRGDQAKTETIRPNRSGQVSESTQQQRAQYVHLVDTLRVRTPSLGAPILLFGAADNLPNAPICVERISREFASRDGINRVLLVDGRLKTRRLSRRLATDNAPGLAESILQGEDWHRWIQPTTTEGLDLLPAGNGLLSMSRAVEDKLKQLSADWKAEYDYILIDGGDTADTIPRLWCSYCDATYLLVTLGETETLAARAAVAELQGHGARLLGCVVCAESMD